MLMKAVAAKNYKFNTWGWIASYSDPDSTGNYSEYHSLQPYLKNLDIDELPRFAFSKVVSEYGENPIGVVRHYVEKASRLYNLGRQGGEYYGNLTPSLLVATDRDAQVVKQVLDAYTGVYAILFAILSIGALTILLFKSPICPSEWLPILFLAIMSAALIAIGEIQSSYVFPAWFILPIYVGMSIENFSLNRFSIQDFRTRLSGMAMPTILVGGLLILFLSWAKFGYEYAAGRFISSRLFKQSDQLTAINPWSVNVKVPNGDNVIEVLQSELPLRKGESYQVNFFLTGQSNQHDPSCVVWLKLLWGSQVINSKVKLAAGHNPIAVVFPALIAQYYTVSFKLEVESKNQTEFVAQCSDLQFDYMRLQQ